MASSGYRYITLGVDESKQLTARRQQLNTLKTRDLMVHTLKDEKNDFLGEPTSGVSQEDDKQVVFTINAFSISFNGGERQDLPGTFISTYVKLPNGDLEEHSSCFSNTLIKILCLAEAGSITLSPEAIDLAEAEERIRRYVNHLEDNEFIDEVIRHLTLIEGRFKHYLQTNDIDMLRSYAQSANQCANNLKFDYLCFRIEKMRDSQKLTSSKEKVDGLLIAAQKYYSITLDPNFILVLDATRELFEVRNQLLVNQDRHQHQAIVRDLNSKLDDYSRLKNEIAADVASYMDQIIFDQRDFLLSEIIVDSQRLDLATKRKVLSLLRAVQQYYSISLNPELISVLDTTKALIEVTNKLLGNRDRGIHQNIVNDLNSKLAAYNTLKNKIATDPRGQKVAGYMLRILSAVMCLTIVLWAFGATEKVNTYGKTLVRKGNAAQKMQELDDEVKEIIKKTPREAKDAVVRPDEEKTNPGSRKPAWRN